MEYTTEQIQEMAKIEANNKKHEHIKLDYQDGIYYGFQQGFEKALSLFAVSGRSEQFACLCPRTKYDDCDRPMPCKECEGCKHFRQANCH